jgi:hypothetical protein
MRQTIDHLSCRELRAVLSFDPDELSDNEAGMLRDFLERIGGLENARIALRMLEHIEQGGAE